MVKNKRFLNHLLFLRKMEINQPKKIYGPSTVLLVLSREDSHLAEIIGRQLKEQGLEAHCESDQVSAVSYYNTHGIDVLLAGAGYEPLVRYVEKNSRQGVFTVAVGDRDCPADLIISSLNDLVCIMEEKKLIELYQENHDAQHSQEEGEEILACLNRQLSKKI